MAKKLISLTKATLIDALVKDEAAVNNTSESGVIEKHLLDSFLPQNEQARFLAENYLYGDESRSIGKTLRALFNYNSAGNGGWSSKHDNLLPIVEFAFEEQGYCSFTSTSNPDKKELPHFLLQLNSICQKLESIEAEAVDLVAKNYYQNEAQYARDLLKEATNEPQYMHYINFYRLVIDNWDILKGLSITYRMLCDLAGMENGWHDRPEARTRLLQLLKEVSEEWG